MIFICLLPHDPLWDRRTDGRMDRRTHTHTHSYRLDYMLIYAGFLHSREGNPPSTVGWQLLPLYVFYPSLLCPLQDPDSQHPLSTTPALLVGTPEADKYNKHLILAKATEESPLALPLDVFLSFFFHFHPSLQRIV